MLMKKAAPGFRWATPWASFSHSLLTGAPLEAPASDAVQLQRVIEAAYRSNDTGRIIDL